MYQEVLKAAYINSCVTEDIPLLFDGLQNSAIEPSSRQSTKNCTTEESDSLSTVCIVCKKGFVRIS